MKTYLIECMETNTFVVEVEAQSEDEARELAHEDINSFEVVKEFVSDWEINLVEEIVNNSSEDFSPDDVQQCILDGTDYSECVDKLVESMNQS